MPLQLRSTETYYENFTKNISDFFFLSFLQFLLAVAQFGGGSERLLWPFGAVQFEGQENEYFKLK
jgi:hypothetical protein